jgi:NADH-quinone oxidoreductase subunit J
MDAIFFAAFAALTLVGAALTVAARNAVHSAVWLIVSLLGTAGLFLFQQAEFLFAVQIILYVGGIMVLFLFVIMLVNLARAEGERQFSPRWWVAAAAVALVIVECAYLVRGGVPTLPGGGPALPAGNVEALADLLFTRYLLPFEAISLLLLVAMVGCVLMARKPEAAK